MIMSFKTVGTEDIFHGKDTKAARKLDQLDSVESLAELRVPPGNRIEALIGARKGQYNIRINEKYRICFSWTKKGPRDVEIVDYH